MKKKLFFLFLSLFLLSISVQARVSLGEVADNALVPVSAASKLLVGCCYILGAGLLAGALIRYTEYRKNPLQVHLTIPVAFLGFGLFLIALPIISGHSISSESVRQPEDNDPPLILNTSTAEPFDSTRPVEHLSPVSPKPQKAAPHHSEKAFSKVPFSNKTNQIKYPPKKVQPNVYSLKIKPLNPNQPNQQNMGSEASKHHSVKGRRIDNFLSREKTTKHAPGTL